MEAAITSAAQRRQILQIRITILAKSILNQMFAASTA
jgi:hypothetical protein